MMPEQLSPFTVSAVVDTTSGALITPPYVRAGHVDYTAHAAALARTAPLRPTHQFRWVQVWARSPAHAAGSETLTADLGVGQGRRPPVARAVTGSTGLKPYTVSARVNRRTRQLVGEAVAVHGHLRPSIAGPWWTRQHTAHVWAINPTAALSQVFGTGHAAGNTAPGTARRARGPALETRQFGTTFEVVPEVHAPGATAGSPSMQPSRAPDTGSGRHRAAATPQAFERVPTPTAHGTARAIAEQQWRRLGGLPGAERTAAVTDAVWRHGYPPVYRAAYTHAASTIAAAATTAARANPAAWLPLHHLAAAAGTAISQIAPNRPIAPPADQATLDAARQAAVHEAATPPWQRIADATMVRIKPAALADGAAAATADIVTGWRHRHAHTLANGMSINGHPAAAWVNNLMAAVNGTASGPPSRGAHADGPRAGTGRTAAHLARQDQAPGAPTAQPPASRTRPRPPGQPPAPTTGARRGR